MRVKRIARNILSGCLLLGNLEILEFSGNFFFTLENPEIFMQFYRYSRKFLELYF